MRATTWPAFLCLLTLACVTPPTLANASQPAAKEAACDAGPCGGQQPAPAPAPATPTPAAPSPSPTSAAPAPAPAPAPGAPTSAPSTPVPTVSAPTPSTASPAPAHAEPLCDTDWMDGQLFVIRVGERKEDGTPPEPFRPSDPMYPYELRGGRFLFGEAGKVIRLAGRFEELEEAQEAKRRLDAEWPSARASVTTLGPYLLPESRTCKVTPMSRMKNPVIDEASWLMDKDGVLLAGTRTQCKNGLLTKKVTVMSCDGMKNLRTDSVQAPCEALRIDTCVRPVVPGVVLLEHSYSKAGGTIIHLRVLDLARKKRVQSLKEAHEGGPDTELVGVEDLDQDGVLEIVYRRARDDALTRVLKWSKGRFVETRSP